VDALDHWGRYRDELVPTDPSPKLKRDITGDTTFQTTCVLRARLRASAD